MRARQETSGTLTNLYLQSEDGYLQAKDGYLQAKDIHLQPRDANLQAGDKEPEGESGKIACKTGGKKNRLTKKIRIFTDALKYK